MDVLFTKCKLNKKRLEAFGFKPVADGYGWETALLGGAFRMGVHLARGGKISTRVVDAATGVDYVLYQVPDAVGEFVGKVREAHRRTLEQIRSSCFDERPFNGNVANRLCRYAQEHFGDQPEFLWKQFPTDAILRRQKTGKWYAVFMEVPRVKLGLTGAGAVEVVDVHIDPNAPTTVPDGKRFFPGYHMNKKSWLTVLLDGSVPFKNSALLLKSSYELAV